MADTDSLLETVLAGVTTACLAGLAAAGIAAPGRVGEWTGAPVMDLAGPGEKDDLLAVWVDRIEARALGERRQSSAGEAQSQGWHTVAAIKVQYHACAPGITDTGSPPSSAATTAATQRLNRAGWAIWVGLSSAVDDGTLFDALGQDGANPAGSAEQIARADIGIGSMTPISPSGYAAGWQLSLEVDLPATLV